MQKPLSNGAKMLSKGYNMKNNTLLTTLRKVIFFSFPISSAMLINMISSSIAMLMVAKISKMELAAGAIALSSNITIMTIVSTIFYSLGILISHLNCQNNSDDEIGQLVKNGLWLAIILAIPSGIILWNADKLLLIIKQDPAVVNLTRNYFHFAALSMLPILVGSVISQFFSGLGNTRFNINMSLISLPMIVFFSYGFILGHFGFPKLGLGGVSGAALMAQLIIYSFLILYLFYAGIIKKYRIFSKGMGINTSVCKKILILGYPIGLQFGAEIGALTVATYMLGHFGVTALAAAQVVQQYILLIVMIVLGVSQGISILISQEYAKNNFVLIKQYINAGLFFALIIFLIVALLFWIFPNQLMKFYMNTDSLQDFDLTNLTKKFFFIAAFTILADSIRNIYSGCLRGLHDSKKPMKVGIACLWFVSLPFSYLMGFNLQGGPIGLRIGFLLGFVLAAILLWRILQSKIHYYLTIGEPDILLEGKI